MGVRWKENLQSAEKVLSIFSTWREENEVFINFARFPLKQLIRAHEILTRDGEKSSLKIMGGDKITL